MTMQDVDYFSSVMMMDAMEMNETWLLWMFRVNLPSSLQYQCARARACVCVCVEESLCTFGETVLVDEECTQGVDIGANTHKSELAGDGTSEVDNSRPGSAVSESAAVKDSVTLVPQVAKLLHGNRAVMAREVCARERDYARSAPNAPTKCVVRNANTNRLETWIQIRTQTVSERHAGISS